jgi:SagB-type dehydrogenase family enzyme
MRRSSFPPRTSGPLSVEEALHERRSIRAFAPAPLALEELSQLLWSAQGITDPRGLRASPSAGATYPLEVYAVVGEVEGVPPGVYRYRPDRHAILPTVPGDRREAVNAASLGQGWIAEAPALLVVAADVSRTAGRYGERARRYVQMEVGHAAQNAYLQAVALGLGTTLVGAFRDDVLARALDLPEHEEPMGILPVGRPR